MIDSAIYHYFETLMGQGPVKGAILNVGLGDGYSARLFLQSRLVNRVSSLEIDEARINSYRTRFTVAEQLESRHTIVLGDASNVTLEIRAALNPPFDFIFTDTISDLSEITHSTARLITSAMKSMLKPTGALSIEHHNDSYEERRFRQWLEDHWIKEIVRPPVSPDGRGRGGAMVLYRPRP